MKIILTLLFLPLFCVQAQLVDVPDQIDFAGMKLHLTSGAQKLIAEDIASISRNQKYFSQKIDRANLYFPLIEKIFEEENCPSDFKFLALQESSLVSDVVSTSNAVGYWQFKKESATEVGLRVDREVDERMNIISSSRGAAKYLKKNNYFLNNWIYTLLAYNLGRGGVASSVKEKYRGASEMEIDKNMHWYVIRFLAHKLAYEKLVGKYPHPELTLQIFPGAANKTLEEVATQTNINLEDLQYYNKWILKSRVPDDKMYPVILPLKINQAGDYIADMSQYEKAKIKYTNEDSEITVKKDHGKTKVKIKNKSGKDKIAMPPGFDESKLPAIITYNKLKAVKARVGDTPAILAYTAGMSLNEFVKRNEMQMSDAIEVGQYYYLEAKRGSALVPFHTVKPEETLWKISQNYGIRINNIRKKNRMKFKENPLPGRVLWLSRKRPRKIPVEYKELKSAPKESQPENLLLHEQKRVVNEPENLPIIAEKRSNSSPDITHVINSELLNVSNRYHTIEQGQTLYAIAKLYATKVDSLRKWNAFERDDLKLGDKIIVGKDLQEKSINSNKNQTIYKVKAGDTIYKISKVFNVSVQDIKSWNNKTDYNVSIGEQIIIVK